MPEMMFRMDSMDFESCWTSTIGWKGAKHFNKDLKRQGGQYKKKFEGQLWQGLAD